MATQFIAAFLLIGLILFLGVVMTVGVVNAKAERAKASAQGKALSKDT